MSRLEDVRLLSDRELVSAHCAGDPDAFGELFRRHRDRMWAVAVRTCGDRETAADAVQDAFLAAFRRADSYRGDAAVTTWLHRITVNACLDRLRRIKPTSPLPNFDTDEIADRHDEHLGVDIRLDVRQALDALPAGQRQALILVDMHGLSVAEAAAVLEVAEGTIKSRCGRGRATMAEMLQIIRPRAASPAPVDGLPGRPVGADVPTERSASP